MTFDQELLTHLPELRKLAFRLTGNQAARDDLVQDTVMRALQYRDRYQDGSNMRAWLCVMMRNTFLTQVRRAGRIQPLDDTWAATLPAKDDPTKRLDLMEVLDVVDTLPPVYAEALMRVAEGEKYDDLAEELGVPAGTVKSRVFRARKELERVFA